MLKNKNKKKSLIQKMSKNYNNKIKMKKLTINLIFKKKYYFLIILANICAFIHWGFLIDVPKINGELTLYPKIQTAAPLNYYSNEILEGIFDYRVITEKSFNELKYPKLKEISFEEFEKISLNTKLKLYSSNSVRNRLVQTSANDEETIRYNIDHFVNIHYEHYFDNYYLKRKKFIDDKLIFVELLKREFNINFDNDPVLTEAAINKLLETETKFKVLEKLFFTKVVNIENVIRMSFAEIIFKDNKPTAYMIFTIYNIIGILLIFCFLTLQLIFLKFQLPAVNVKFD